MEKFRITKIKSFLIGDSRVARWRRLVFFGLYIGYVGLYMCRSDLTVANPLLVSYGISLEQIGFIITIGTTTYMIGKIIGGTYITDFFGGRVMFCICCVGSIVSSIMFGLLGSKHYGWMVFWWAINRLFQSLAWPAVMKVIALWFDSNDHGKVVGAVSTSYLFGDAFVRFVLGAFVHWGFSWQGLFYVAGLSLIFTTAIVVICLKHEDPTKVGGESVKTANINVYGDDANKPANLKELIIPLLKSFPFYLLLIMSLGLTFIRETLRDWVVLFLQEQTSLSVSLSSIASTSYIIAGGISALCTGYLLDRKWASNKRGYILSVYLFVLIISLGILYFISRNGTKLNLGWTLVLLSIVGFTMTGPYSLSALFSLNLGGKKAPSTISSINDGIGYLGSIFSGIATGTLATKYGWGVVFLMLALFAVMTLASTLTFGYFFERKQAEKEKENLTETQEQSLPMLSVNSEK